MESNKRKRIMREKNTKVIMLKRPALKRIEVGVERKTKYVRL